MGAMVATMSDEDIWRLNRGGHDLVIKNAEPGGLSGSSFGANDMHLMRKCPCPVWIIKPTERHKYHRILAAVDQAPEGAQ